ncbi:MAG TPA: threonine/serine dehydratase [Bryobacteraceae bacterium]|nr:threonine/serine dehydratase [Bryobacteraceae bacterium]
MDLLDVTHDHILQARERIRQHVKRTATVPSQTLSRWLGANVFLKLELFQKTGSFKVRGVFNKLLSTPDARNARGIVAVSGGNHAQAVAYASAALGYKALILMPRTTPANYVAATRGYGAEIEFAESARHAFDRISSYQNEGWLPIHPYDDPLVIAGQGTAGLEIIEDVPDATDVIVSIGGGGFISGVATAIKSVKPGVRMWGVETIGADAMSQALQCGHPVELTTITSIAKTLGAPSVSVRTLAYTKHLVQRVILVPDRDAVRAIECLLERAKVLTEPAAACTWSAAEQLRDTLGSSSNVVLVLCGGNLAIEDLCRYRSQFQIGEKSAD